MHAMRSILIWTALAAVFFALASVIAACATPAATGVAIGSGIGAAVELFNAFAPLLPPEKQAKLLTLAGTIDGGMEATTTAVGVIADAIVSFKSATQTAFDATKDALHAAQVQVAQLPTRGEILAHDAGVGSTAVAASRVMSHFKHREGRRAASK